MGVCSESHPVPSQAASLDTRLGRRETDGVFRQSDESDLTACPSAMLRDRYTQEQVPPMMNFMDSQQQIWLPEPEISISLFPRGNSRIPTQRSLKSRPGSFNLIYVGVGRRQLCPVGRSVCKRGTKKVGSGTPPPQLKMVTSRCSIIPVSNRDHGALWRLLPPFSG